MTLKWGQGHQGFDLQSKHLELSLRYIFASLDGSLDISFLVKFLYI